MPLLSKVGTITAPASTGSQAYTGVGFQPKCVLYWTNGVQSVPGFHPTRNMSWAIGWRTNGSNSEAKLARAAVAEDNVGTTDGEGRLEVSGPSLAMTTPDLFSISTGTVTTLDSDGFTINWTNVSGGQIVWNYLALGGDELLVHADTFTQSGSTGVQSVQWPTDQPHFVPTFVLFLNGATGDSCAGTLGFSDGSNHGCYSFNSRAAQPATEAYRYQRTNKAIATIGSTGSVIRECTLTGFQDRGFTLDWTIANSATCNFLALGGVASFVGSLLQPTSTGDQAITGVGFTPGPVFLASIGNAAATTVQTHNRVSMGAGDGTTSVVGAIHNEHGADPTVNVNYQSAGAAVASVTAAASAGSSTVQALGSVASIDSDGFTLNWSTVDATQREVIYFALAGSDEPPTLSTRNLLTGLTHTATGGDNLIVGESGTIEGDRVALFNMKDDVPFTYTGDNAFIVKADYVEINGSDITTGTGSAALDDLTDVDAASPSDGDVLAFDSGSGDWVNTPLPPGSAWSLAASWTHSVDVATVDFTNLGAYSEILVIGDSVTKGTSSTYGIRVSTNNGSSYFAGASDYQIVAGAGTLTAADSFSLHVTNATAARTGVMQIMGFNVAGAPKLLHSPNRGAAALFVGSTSALDAIRLFNLVGGNFTGGSFYVYGR